MWYNDAAKEAEVQFGKVDWDRIGWRDDGTPDVDTNDLSQEESARYQAVAQYVHEHSDA